MCTNAIHGTVPFCRYYPKRTNTAKLASTAPSKNEHQWLHQYIILPISRSIEFLHDITNVPALKNYLEVPLDSCAPMGVTRRAICIMEWRTKVIAVWTDHMNYKIQESHQECNQIDRHEH
jgi:hypothetical protein